MPAPAPPSQQQTLSQFYSAVQNLRTQVAQTPGMRDRLDDDLQVAEFLVSLDKLGAMDATTDDISRVQGFLRNNLKMSNVGDADGKIGTRLVQALQQSFGPLSRYTPPPATPHPATSPQLGNYRLSTHSPQSVVFPDMPWPSQTPRQTQNVGGSALVQAVTAPSRSAEAQATVADIAKVISARSGSEGGKCYAGVKKILSQLDKIGHAAELGPKSKEYRQMLARYPRLKPILEKLSADPGLAAAVRKGQILFPPNSGSAYMGAATLGAPGSPYQLLSEGSNDDVEAEDLRDPKRFPPGAIIVWDRSPLLAQSEERGPNGKPTQAAKAAQREIAAMKKSGEWDVGHVHGHIAVVGPAPKDDERRREYSDKDYGLKPHYGGGNYQVFVLK